MSSKHTQIILSGSTGRMGQEIAKIIDSSKNMSLLANISKKNSAWIQIKPSANAVVVDFSLPEGFREACDWCQKNKVPLITGTTGLSEKDFSLLKSTSKKTPVLWSANMSYGISLFKKLIRNLKNLEGFEFQIVEAHHKHKKDAPSGTAKDLQKTLEDSQSNKKSIFPPLSIRGGGIQGIHTLMVMGEGETLEITHQALNRAVFAEGALRAARWIVGQKPGLYSLEDMD